MSNPLRQRALDLARELVRMNTVNPPGSEHPAAIKIAGRLEAAGFAVDVHTFPEKRVNVVARSPRSGSSPTQCWTGHLDTVPLGEAEWAVDPFAADVSDGRLYGRGATDMKAGIAAMVVAAEQTAANAGPPPGLSLIFTAGEETGCEGARALAERSDLLPQADVLLVGEPTANTPVLGHKGVVWLELTTTGRAAHASRPGEGVNAIDLLVDTLVRLRDFRTHSTDDLLGTATRSLGTIVGGVGVNVVPDRATARVDLRTLPSTDHDGLIRDLGDHLGTTVGVDVLASLPAIRTESHDPRLARVLDAIAQVRDTPVVSTGMSYFTDASVLAPAMRDCAVVLFGPGDPSQAHATDEWCDVANLEEATEIYGQLAASCRQQP